jgi:hypothetical protein
LQILYASHQQGQEIEANLLAPEEFSAAPGQSRPVSWENRAAGERTKH